MRKIKLQLQYRVPSWNFCNHDSYTAAPNFSKERCRFCVSTKGGYHCLLTDEDLTSDSSFINKTATCIHATAGFAVSADEPNIQVDPKLIMRETLITYNKALNDLLNRGYPRQMAETIANKYVLGDK